MMEHELWTEIVRYYFSSKKKEIRGLLFGLNTVVFGLGSFCGLILVAVMTERNINVTPYTILFAISIPFMALAIMSIVNVREIIGIWQLNKLDSYVAAGNHHFFATDDQLRTFVNIPDSKDFGPITFMYQRPIKISVSMGYRNLWFFLPKKSEIRQAVNAISILNCGQLYYSMDFLTNDGDRKFGRIISNELEKYYVVIFKTDDDALSAKLRM